MRRRCRTIPGARSAKAIISFRHALLGRLVRVHRAVSGGIAGRFDDNRRCRGITGAYISDPWNLHTDRACKRLLRVRVTMNGMSAAAGWVSPDAMSPASVGIPQGSDVELPRMTWPATSRVSAVPAQAAGRLRETPRSKIRLT